MKPHLTKGNQNIALNGTPMGLNASLAMSPKTTSNPLEDSEGVMISSGSPHSASELKSTRGCF